MYEMHGEPMERVQQTILLNIIYRRGGKVEPSDLGGDADLLP